MKRAIIMLSILLPTIVTLSHTSVLGQTQKILSDNTMFSSTNSSFIKDTLDSIHNDTIPNYVKLSDNQISETLNDLPGWVVLDGKLHKTFKFVDFSTLFEFMFKVAEVSQKFNHHPNMTSTWNTLTLDYDTWSLGHVISNLDVKAAQNVEKTYQDGNYTNIKS
ncbi:MAG TPA: 4a-hydroxytetrahydrobiopterin dehydratase [Nitrososphaeraceae archaeon]|jgi:4a-hydroxytetrahydrobiopterin dehydratase